MAAIGAPSISDRPVLSVIDKPLRALRKKYNWILWIEESLLLDSGLRDKLNKIMASNYFTNTPEIKAHVEMAVAAGGYGSFQVTAHESMVPVDMPVHMESSMVQYPQKVSNLIMFEWLVTLNLVSFSGHKCSPPAILTWMQLVDWPLFCLVCVMEWCYILDSLCRDNTLCKPYNLLNSIRYWEFRSTLLFGQ